MRIARSQPRLFGSSYVLQMSGNSVLLYRAGFDEPDRIVDLLEAGAEPLRDLIAAMHSKLLVEELRRQRDSREGRPPH